MFEFLEVTRSYLVTTCSLCRDWIASTANTNSVLNSKENGELLLVEVEVGAGAQHRKSVSLLQNLVLAVQRVILRHRKLATETEKNSS